MPQRLRFARFGCRGRPSAARARSSRKASMSAYGIPVSGSLFRQHTQAQSCHELLTPHDTGTMYQLSSHPNMQDALLHLQASGRCDYILHIVLAPEIVCTTTAGTCSARAAL